MNVNESNTICLTPEQRAELAEKYPPSAPRPPPRDPLVLLNVTSLAVQVREQLRRDDLYRDYMSGTPIRELLSKYGPTAVEEARRQGARREYKREPTEKLDRAIAWLLAWPGVPDTQLAVEAGLSISYVQLVRKQLGLPISSKCKE